MKRVVIIASLIGGLGYSAFAQQEELRSATTKLEKKDYVGALDDLGKARKAITKLVSDNLASVLPAKFGEFEMQTDEFGGMMEMGGVSVNKTYRKPSSTGQAGEGRSTNDPAMMAEPMMQTEQITVTITTNMMSAGEVMSAHSMQENGMASDQVKPIRVKGYRAITKEFGGMGAEAMSPKMEQAQAIVGGAFVSVDVQGGKEPGQALKLLETIDFDKLISIVGK
ncbi:MAG: hypothetical protein EP314_00990 [Bacteroidetes bacterium]|nr:MAG: hypothetical protein EP314_00990 [Bacteroidota bacterium]